MASTPRPAGPVGPLGAEQVQQVLLAATKAPSLHNLQPWRFVCNDVSIQLRRDSERSLPVADPDGRASVLACGAALLNLRLAIEAYGADPGVMLFPDPADRWHLATLTPTPATRTRADVASLVEAIPRRHTHRRPFTDQQVPQTVRHELAVAAKAEQASLLIVPNEHHADLREQLSQAHRIQQNDSAFQQEWQQWTGRDIASADGVAADTSGPLPEQQDQWVLRDFSAGTARARLPGKDFEVEPLLMVVATDTDLPVAHLQAGAAMQRVLLAATARGVAASFLSQVTEVPQTRSALRDLLGPAGRWPQIVLRLGYGSPAPSSSRRSLGDVVDPSG